MPPLLIGNGSAAPEADDRLVYDQEAGRLFYDADGGSLNNAVLFATFEPGTVLDRTDFV